MPSFTKSLFTLVTVAGTTISCPLTVRAQHPAAPKKNSVPTSAPVESTDAFLPAGWQHLPRMHTLTTFMQRDTTISEAVRALRLSTGAKLQAEGNELLPAHVSLHYRNVPLADVLRGIAAARNLEWVKTEAGELVLRQHRAHVLDAHHPHSEAEADMIRKGQELVKQAMALPPALQQDLQRSASTNHTTAPEGAAFTDLPPAMQQAARAMYGARAQMLPDEGAPLLFAPDELPSTRLRMDVNVQEGVTFYGFQIDGDAKGQGMWTLTFHDPKEGYAVVSKEAAEAFYKPRTYPEDAAMQQQAQAEATCLKTRVHLPSGTYTLPEVLFAMAAQAHFHFALPLDRSIGTRKFRCDDETLGDVLPRLCRAFAFTTPMTGKRWEWSWNWRKDDFFVFHWRPQADKRQTAGKLDTTRGSRSMSAQDKQAVSP